LTEARDGIKKLKNVESNLRQQLDDKNSTKIGSVTLLEVEKKKNSTIQQDLNRCIQELESSRQRE
jgi:hypothetical protein